jgi:hypothetical protein
MALLTFEYKQSFDSFSFELMLVIRVITEINVVMFKVVLDIVEVLVSMFKLLIMMV